MDSSRRVHPAGDRRGRPVLLSGAGGPWPVILIIAFLLGFNYGANLALFPRPARITSGYAISGSTTGCSSRPSGRPVW
jgi:hypothetical protein